MGNDVTGGVRDNGTVVQVRDVHGDVVLQQGNRRRSPRRRDSGPQPWFGKARLALAARLGVAALLVITVPYGLITTLTGDRPAGATDAVVVRLVADKLRSCEIEVVEAPVNCPQRAKAPGAHTVSWEFVGDPVDGMRVEWGGSWFSAHGAAAMLIHYKTENGRGQEVIMFRYLAQEPWRGADTRIDRLPYIEYPLEVRKNGFELPRSTVEEFVRIGFNLCVEAATAPMPAGCPRVVPGPIFPAVEWSFNADPLSNWRMENDSTFGLVRAVGSYSISLRRLDELNTRARHFTQQGTFVATLVRQPDGSDRLLEIRHVP